MNSTFPGREYGMQTPSILVIDDVVDIVVEMIAMFALVGVRATGAQTIDEGLMRLRQDTTIGLVICDLHLRREDGRVLARRIGSDAALADRDIDIVFMTGDAKADDPLASLPGATLLCKPIDPNELIRRAQACLEAKVA
jgi:CheY-like chemotaxis protein